MLKKKPVIWIAIPKRLKRRKVRLSKLIVCYFDLEVAVIYLLGFYVQKRCFGEEIELKRYSGTNEYDSYDKIVEHYC